MTTVLQNLLWECQCDNFENRLIFDGVIHVAMHQLLSEVLAKVGGYMDNILQGSVATQLRCGGIFNDDCIANVLLWVTVKDVWK